MLFKQTVAVYTGKHAKLINTKFVASSWLLKQMVRMFTTKELK
jgi:hypothetical protein